MKKHSNLYKRKLKSIEKNVLEATVVEEDIIYNFDGEVRHYFEHFPISIKPISYCKGY